MSLFNRSSLGRQQNQATLGPAEAFAAITLVAVAADGYAADSEKRVERERALTNALVPSCSTQPQQLA